MGNTIYRPAFSLGEFAVDEARPLKVVVIGAGYSGIAAGVRFPQRVKNIDLTIYEKNAGVGGTWYSNRYPGIACDVPSHTYQFTFENNPEWSSFYAPGPEIRAYLEHVVEKYGLARYIKLQHELVYAQYDEAGGKWHLRIRRPSPNSETCFEVFEDTADFVFCGVGCLSRWSWPAIPGLDAFEGKLMHSADWDMDDSLDEWKDKRVGVVGVGSSAIQMVPALQPHVAKLYNFVRGKTWLATPFFADKLSEMTGRDPGMDHYEFDERDKGVFRDPVYYQAFRHRLEAELNSIHRLTLRDPKREVEDHDKFVTNMKSRLSKKPWIADHLVPTFPVACRRLTPGPGYLEALCEDNVEFVPKDIRRITPTGLETTDGEHYAMDVLICATGFDTSYQFPFPVVGRSGRTLQQRWSPHPVTYLSLCTDGFPNWFNGLGPNSGIGAGSLLIMIEREVEYAAAVLLKMQRERLKSIDVKREAVEDFERYIEAYFPKTVYSAKCRSWYKMGKEEGRIVGLWPGSCLHAVRAMERPRWEDYEYEYLDGVRNRFHWLGDGSTCSEKYKIGDRAWYMDEVDYPPVPDSSTLQTD